MGVLEQSALGKATAYAVHYDPTLLFPLPRAAKRGELGLGAKLPFHGEDVWNAYELSWLDVRGKPQVALAEFRVPATTPKLIESKSLKLYLNGYAQERMADAGRLRERIAKDLSVAAGGTVGVELYEASHAPPPAPLAGTLLDTLDLAIDCYGPPRPDFLAVHADAEETGETLVSHLLRSNCPVTGQPDWGSVAIAYRGAPIDHAGLLRYLVSFRLHSEFHEHCVERIFVDLMQRCAPRELSVYARYTRRGGLDINPFRSTRDVPAANVRTPRQ